tara:strand:+ start:748 stop:966 length:219 start_codon:yes stop_codon:yes gene_type:complete
MAKIAGSSAIAAINFGEDNAVSVQFTSNDTAYGFVAKDSVRFQNELQSALDKGESVGRLVAASRASGELKAV